MHVKDDGTQDDRKDQQGNPQPSRWYSLGLLGRLLSMRSAETRRVAAAERSYEQVWQVLIKCLRSITVPHVNMMLKEKASALVAGNLLESSDPQTHRVRAIFTKLLAAAQAHHTGDREVLRRLRTTPWAVTVVAKEETNAHVHSAAGKVVVYTRLAQKMSDEQLAFVLAHEIAHSIAEHEQLGQLVHKEARSQLQRVDRAIEAGTADSLAYKPIYQAKSQRLHAMERQADLLGQQLMAAACYHPQGSLDAMAKLGAGRAPKSELLTEFGTHPSARTRSQYLSEALPEAVKVFASSGCAWPYQKAVEGWSSLRASS